MIVFPAAKINLGLNVVRLRPDGYHEIESVLVPIPLHDVLEVVRAEDLSPGHIQFTRSGRSVPGDPAQDLCIRAHSLLHARYGLPGLRAHLHKVIPIGAGLGGGSSDGAHFLSAVNELLSLGADHDELAEMAAELGSDCPFFLRPITQLATGRGEHLAPLEVSLKGVWLVLVNPGIHVPTVEAYRGTKPTGVSSDLARSLSALPMEQWQGHIVNSMEAFAVGKWPAIGQLIEDLKQAGASYAAMSGSGSSVFGLFKEKPGAMRWPEGHHAWVLRL